MAKLNEKDLAKDYGFTLAFLKSAGSEVEGLFKKAVAGTWSGDKFEAAIRNTKWFKTHGETYRQQLALQTTDPGTYGQNLNSAIATVRDKAAQIGATLTPTQSKQFADNSVKFGWNDSQLSDTLSNYISFFNTHGQATSNITAMQQSAWRNGLKLSPATLQTWSRQVARGNSTMDDFTKYVRTQAASLAPNFKDELDAGMDLYDIASPYMQSMASTLELNPADINLFDPTIRSAMSGKDQNGKPASKSLWQFEQDVKQDPRYMKTQGAQNAAFSTAHKVLSDFGMVS